MRIMIDTNIFISAILFPDSITAELLNRVILKYNLVLCDQIETEIHDVIDRKFPNKKDDLEEFLTHLSYESIYTPRKIKKDKYPEIRDEKDLPILVSAILGDVDYFITGDKDFFAINLERPKIISARDFLEQVD